jgi:hypothetical protein
MRLTRQSRVWLTVLRLHLALAAGMLAFKLVQLALGGD